MHSLTNLVLCMISNRPILQYDVTHQRELACLNGTEPYQVASITKVMTAHLVLQVCRSIATYTAVLGAAAGRG